MNLKMRVKIRFKMFYWLLEQQHGFYLAYSRN